MDRAARHTPSDGLRDLFGAQLARPVRRKSGAPPLKTKNPQVRQICRVGGRIGAFLGYAEYVTYLPYLGIIKRRNTPKRAPGILK